MCPDKCSPKPFSMVYLNIYNLSSLLNIALTTNYTSALQAVNCTLALQAVNCTLLQFVIPFSPTGCNKQKVNREKMTYLAHHTYALINVLAELMLPAQTQKKTSSIPLAS